MDENELPEVIFPLIALLCDISDDQRAIADFSFHHHKTNLVPFLLKKMSESKKSSSSTPATKKQKMIEKKDYTVRQLMQEMREIGKENITCDYILKNGERVGEFLLRQWLEKENKKKK
jgi:hypothetical protein